MHHVLTAPDQVTTSAALREQGMSRHAMATRSRPSGPWQQLLPGVFLTSKLRPTRRQRLRAAVLYAGDDAVVTGVDAMRAHGIDVPAPQDVLVLIPAERRLSSRSYLTVERTTRPPTPVTLATLPYAPLARATLDAARRAGDHELLTTMLTAAAGTCSVAELRAELDAGSQRGSAAVRALLTESLTDAHGVVPATTSAARRLLRSTRLPPPRWHTPVYDRTGMLVGTPDAWWQEVSLAWDVGGPNTRHHEPKLWTAAGTTLLRTDPARLHANPSAVTAELLAVYAASTLRRAS